MEGSSSISPLIKTRQAFFHDAEMLVDLKTNVQSGDKLSWINHRDGSISPQIFKNHVAQEAFRGFYSRFSKSSIDGDTASRNAIKWSLGYVASGNIRKTDGALTYQERLVNVFTAFAQTY
ncbi:MAG: hypothetical protein K940chlam1_00727, partial [Candidatus Anoxychlamydiales bacterium]|nr:hypothetical protein [Candidatus Anoxychlamydiales bacterium]